MGIINTTGCATKEHIQWDHYKILDPDHGSQAAQIMAKFRALMYFKFGPFLDHFWNFSDFQSSSVFLILHPGTEDHFRTLVFMKTTSLIEDLYATIAHHF